MARPWRPWQWMTILLGLAWCHLGAAAEPLPGGVRLEPGSSNGFVSELCPQYYVSHESGVLACPNTQDLTILPGHYPPRALFVGYSPEPSFLAFLSALIAHNARRSHPLRIIILAPRLDTEQAYRDLKPYMHGAQSRHLTFFATPSDETLWMQDYMEIALSLKDGRLRLIDLPYIDREGEALPSAIALSCQYDLIPQPEYSDEDDSADWPDHGNYGGNIEALPGNLLLVGNTMNQTTQTHLRQVLPQMTPLIINVRWLETGHVDELFAVLPDRSAGAACPFAMAYTSPKLALDLAQQTHFNARKQISPPPVEIQDVSVELKDLSIFTTCLSNYAQHRSGKEHCRRFIQANLAYEELIQQQRRQIDKALMQRKTCAQIKWIALPQLFAPSHEVWLEDGNWGSAQDAAQALNPNVVNMIALGEEVIAPEQPYAPFGQEVARRLQELGLTLTRVDSTLSHYLSGGLHCNTAVARMCGAKPAVLR